MTLTFRPLTDDDRPALRAMLHAPEVARWWPPYAIDEHKGETRFAIEVDGELAGMIQYDEEIERDWKQAEVDIFLGPAFIGRGIGTEAMRAMVDLLVEERGHHRVVLGTEVDNVAAQRCYEKAGFRKVGIMEACTRDHATGEWRDEVLMEWVRRPAPSP